MPGAGLRKPSKQEHARIKASRNIRFHKRLGPSWSCDAQTANALRSDPKYAPKSRSGSCVRPGLINRSQLPLVPSDGPVGAASSKASRTCSSVIARRRGGCTSKPSPPNRSKRSSRLLKNRILGLILSMCRLKPNRGTSGDQRRLGGNACGCTSYLTLQTD